MNEKHEICRLRKISSCTVLPSTKLQPNLLFCYMSCQISKMGLRSLTAFWDTCGQNIDTTWKKTTSRIRRENVTLQWQKIIQNQNLLFLSWLPTDDGVEHRNVLKSNYYLYHRICLTINKIAYYQHLLVSLEELLSLRLSDHFALVVGCINNNWLNYSKWLAAKRTLTNCGRDAVKCRSR